MRSGNKTLAEKQTKVIVTLYDAGVLPISFVDCALEVSVSWQHGYRKPVQAVSLK